MAEGDATPLKIRLFGPLEVHCNGRPLPKLRSQKGKWLLALLTLRHGKDVQRSWLASTIWGENDGNLGSLSTSLTNLRKALGPEAVRISSPSSRTLCLNLTGADVDVTAFDAAVTSDDFETLKKAVALYRGPFLEGCLELWVAQEREARITAYVGALAKLADRALADSDREYAIECLSKAVSVSIDEENVHRRLMTVLANAGNFTGALDVYHDLRRRLQAEYSGPENPTPEEATTALYNNIRQRAREQAGSHSHFRTELADTCPSPLNIPRLLTPLIGRDKALHAVIAALLSKPMVTLVGPGGVGKTRLATEAAIEIAKNFRHGIHVVRLETLTDPQLLPQQVAKTVGVGNTCGRTWTEDLLQFLHPREILLVLDNCEHLVNTCADFVRLLFERSPGLKILATSRERLGLTGEVVQTVAPLPVPALDMSLDFEQYLTYPSIRLFCERAIAARSDFSLILPNVVTIAQICRRLDGLPLALELAAAHVETLSVQDIDAHLKHLLDTGDRSAPPRHQSLVATLDWSYNLLTAPQQTLFSYLCVFSGGWTLAAAKALYPGQFSGKNSALALLSRLVSKSLVVAKEDLQGMRYRLLETIREYARMRLADPTVWRRIQGQHCAYFTSFAEEAEAQLLGPDQGIWLDKLELEHGNLRAALTWAAGEDGNVSLALRLGIALWRFWYARGYHREGQSWLQRILNLPGPKPAVLYKAIGNLHYAQGEYATARPYFEECLSLAQRAQNGREQASALASLANVEMGEKNYTQARVLFEESLHFFQETGDTRGIALTLSNLARLLCEHEKDYTTALDFHVRSLALFRDLGALHNVARECCNVCETLFQLDKTAEVRVYLKESLALSKDLENLRILAHCLTHYCALAVTEGELERAALIMGAEVALREKINYPLPASAVSDHKRDEELVARGLDNTTFERCREQGQKMTAEAVRAYVLERSQ